MPEGHLKQVIIYGLGHIGLPLALTFAEAGIAVHGVDIRLQTIECLRRGESPLSHIRHQRLQAVSGSLTFSTAADVPISSAQAIFICVPTPLDEHRQPDLHPLLSAVEMAAGQLQKGMTLILESTSYPGTARHLVAPLIEKLTGLQVGTDVFLAVSPEREDPGNAEWSIKTIPKLVGGIDEASTAAAVHILSAVIDHVVPCSSAEVAEAAKLYENIFRAVNIALACEVEQVCVQHQVDFKEVLAAASTKPFGFMPFFAGLGVGGPCIPVNPHYFKKWAGEGQTPLIDQALAVNDQRAEVIAQRLFAQYAGADLPEGVLPTSYKPGVNDSRGCPSYAIEKAYRKLQQAQQIHKS